MSGSRCIAIDVMGGDFGPSVTLPAVMSMLTGHRNLHCVLSGNQDSMTPWLQSMAPSLRARVRVLHTPDQLNDDTSPLSAIRQHRNSSLFLAIDQVRSGQADACVSAGNTGALIMIARHLLRTLPGISRPAMMACLPDLLHGGVCHLLDVGAHINSRADDLVEYARMANIVVHRQLGRPPRVALLNIGAEAHKGTEVIREAAARLEALQEMDYTGYIEPAALYSGIADVVVCDGLMGNITIKTSAGVVRTAEALWRQIAGKTLLNRIKARLAGSLFRELKHTIDPALFNGASVLGLNGIIVKSHGNANTLGFAAAIGQALREIDSDLPGLIRTGLGTEVQTNK